MTIEQSRTLIETIAPSWTDHIRIDPVDSNSVSDSFITVISWNILAEAYTSPRSHPNLPPEYANVVFDTDHRCKLILDSLRRLLFLQQETPTLHVLCLQEVEATLLSSTLGPFFQSLGYQYVYAPRATKNHSHDDNSSVPDGCAIVYSSKWRCLASTIVRFDDLADDTRPSFRHPQQHQHTVHRFPSTTRSSNVSILSSYRRRNAALLVHLVSTSPQETTSVIIGNTHLYWHPGYEYIKLSQAYYLLYHLQQFRQEQGNQYHPVVILCGDFNSKPQSIVYKFITRGLVDATTVAPWKNHSSFYEHFQSSSFEQTLDSNVFSFSDEDFDFTSLKIHDNPSNIQSTHSNPKYMLDYTLNKLSRWLRILGLDAALETEDEERARTQEGNIILFQKCRLERRNLITTSVKLTQRKETPPGTYLITPTRNSQELEDALVHLLLLHDVILKPALFLTRCVVCNGAIVDVPSKEQQASIFAQYGSPNFCNELEVFQCSSCGQGYWWSESPNSSASRVKDLSTQLFVKCLRGGVPIEGPLNFFQFVDVEKEQRIGLEERNAKLLPLVPIGGVEEVLSWLKERELRHSFHFRSAYMEGDTAKGDCALLKFTNVTSGFVGLLDYIFYDEDTLELTGRLFVPTSFRMLNYKCVLGGHLLPSDVWPSDHLAVGASFKIKRSQQEASREVNVSICLPTSEKTDHDAKCSCGCIPPVLSLFEMAELRRQYRLKQVAPD